MVRIFEEIRKDNGELSGKLEEKDYAIGLLEHKNHKI